MLPPLADAALPASNVMLPPSAAPKESPTLTTTLPPAPSVAGGPVPIKSDPVLPTAEVPLLKANLPLAPAVPALTDLIMIAPDE